MKQIKFLINITETQAAGIEVNDTVDHLIILKYTMNKKRKKGNILHVLGHENSAFLCILDINGTKRKMGNG